MSQYFLKRNMSKTVKQKAVGLVTIEYYSYFKYDLSNDYLSLILNDP